MNPSERRKSADRLSTTKTEAPKLPTAESFLSRLNSQDKTTVTKVVDIVKGLVNIYDGTHPAFFAVYGIGGNVTKQGERPDVDLLIVTSAYWDGGYEPLIERKMASLRNEDNWDEYDLLRIIREKDEDFDYSTEEGRNQARKIHKLKEDWVCGSIKDQLKDSYSAEVLDELPDNYNMGAGTKGLLRLTPVRNFTPEITAEQPDARKPIDIVYVRAVRYIPPEESKTGSYGKRTLEYFETTTDTDLNGQPLPKVPLYRTDNRGREMSWH